MGFSFAAFYTLLDIPLGRLADSRSRRLIIAVGIASWSVMTAGCGLARRFWHPALFRMGGGMGEASLSPAASSLIADSFRPQHCATATGVYSMGIYIRSGLAFILGGLVVKFASGREQFDLPLVGATCGWRVIFFLVGLHGLLVALLLGTVREPTRQGVRPAGRRATPPGGRARPCGLARPRRATAAPGRSGGADDRNGRTDGEVDGLRNGPGGD
jgi:MFS family permease